MTAPSSPALPVLWLLGKTGAGKSSILQGLTGLTGAQIGNGFESCTKTATAFDFPPEAPLMRFLDTRGLGEALYDPREDLAALQGAAHMILLVARLDEPEQTEIAAALRAALKRDPMPVLIVYTGADLAGSPTDARRLEAELQGKFEAAAGRALPAVRLERTGDRYSPESLEALSLALAQTLPDLASILSRDQDRGAESLAFEGLRSMVLTHAGIAGASDVMPIVGTFAVPATQMRLLVKIGEHYHVTWNRALLWRFAAALGTGISAQYLSLFALRQLGKVVPVVGQTVIAAAAGGISFATTYALGRVAAAYLYHQTQDSPITKEELRDLYRESFKRHKKDPSA